jgi:hypothetical protein
MDIAEVETLLKNIKQPGFEYRQEIRLPGAKAWIVLIQAATMKRPWTIAVTCEEKAESHLTVGTSLYQSEEKFPAHVIEWAMRKNSLDHMLGALALHEDKAKDGVTPQYFLQLLVRTRLEHLSAKKIEFDIGYVAGYADGLTEELGNQFKS